MSAFTKGIVNYNLNEFYRSTGCSTHLSRYRKSVDERYSSYRLGFANFIGKSVIDIGCFTGFYSCLMAPYADHVLGIDTNRPALVHANKMRALFNCENVTFKHKSAFTLSSEYLRANSITGLFIHKTMSPDSKWTDKRQKAFWDLMKEQMDVIVASSTPPGSGKVDILRPVFAKDDRFKIIEIENHLVAIVRV